jgi:hypothetical protein
MPGVSVLVDLVKGRKLVEGIPPERIEKVSRQKH